MEDVADDVEHFIDLADELILIAAAKGGDEGARNKLLQVHERFIWSRCVAYAGRYQRYEAEDLFGEASLGFVKAIEGFNPDLGWKLITYAGTAIWRRLDRMRMGDRVIKVMVNLGATGHQPEQRTREQALAAIHGVMSLSGTARDDSEFQVEDYRHRPLYDDSPKPPNMWDVQTVLEECPEQWRRVVAMRSIGMTLDQIGKAFSRSKERIRQIEEKAFAAVRAAMGRDPNARVYWEMKRPAKPIKQRSATAQLDERCMEKIEAAIPGLQPKWQQVIRLRIDGMTIQQIAKEMEISDTRVRAIEGNALRALSKAICRHVTTIDLWFRLKKGA